MKRAIGRKRLADMDSYNSAASAASENQKTYVAVYRARSSVRLKPEDTFETTITGVPDCNGPIRLRIRTIWKDAGHKSPLPRELWFEAKGPAPTLDHAAAQFETIARHFAVLASFVANVSAGVPEGHIIYNASPLETDREFLEVFQADERGHVREGRILKLEELSAVAKALSGRGRNKQVGIALFQYSIALRFWYFGGEAVALSHLYMAVEALKNPIADKRSDDRGLTRRELAEIEQIDVSNSGKWQHDFDVWIRQELIFQGDVETYRDARYASDGFEHGFLGVDEVQGKAVMATFKTFQYVRSAILNLLGISEVNFSELYERPPRDVESRRKMVRGRLIGDGSDPAPATELYPSLNWRSSIKTFTREFDTFNAAFEEKFTVQCSPSYGFKGEAFEVRGRLEPGQDTIETLENIDVTQESNSDEELRTNRLRELLSKTVDFASATFRGSSLESGTSPVNEQIIGIFVEQLSLVEAIDVLLRDNRAVEAVILLRSLFLGTSLLQAVARSGNVSGMALRLRLDSLSRLPWNSDSEDVNVGARNAVFSAAGRHGVTIPDNLPPLNDSPFYVNSLKSIKFSDDVALGGGLAGSLHMSLTDDGALSASTKIVDARFADGVAADAAEALRTATEALASALRWPYDAEMAASLTAELNDISAELSASNGSPPSDVS